VVELKVGQFVRAAGQQLGIGKCLGVSGGEVEIEYFDSISATGRRTATARRSQVKPVQVSPQRRCYWEDKTGWRVGRVVWQGDGEYGVRPPNSDFDIKIPEEELYVRWDKPIDDPTDVLVARGNESPYFHLRRYPFLATTTRQRAASHGMHGVTSSVIDLYDHQIEVARRVLEDSKQRYLLADEVGLGKTIEAGIIIRQYLLDHPEGHVVIITPPLLRRQWVLELRQKFLIDDFDRAVVSVLAHDKPESWLEGARDGLGRFSWHSKAGLVVVDEAHHLAALASASGDAGNRYSVLAGLTAGVPRLLLLSATPLLNNERTFLAMLHLLDPDIYRLSDIEGFRRRIRDRQALGTAFFTFRSDIPPFLLRDKVSALRAMFPGDEQLAALLDRVSEALGNPSALSDAVMAARIHISETYRVHRRLLRTRRNDAILDDFPVRGRQRPVTIPLSDPDETTQEWLDDWRDYVRSTLDSSPAAHAGARRAFIAMAERVGSHPGLAAAAARYRLEPSASHARHAELTTAEQDALSSWAADDIEREILERGSRLGIDPAILPALVRFLKDARRKTVVFTSFTMTARHVRDALAGEFGSHAIAAHLADDDPAAVEEEVDRFRDAADSCWILVCDRSAEEGRNFQFADQAINFDLPFSPNRLEQRIGRLDRYGRGSAIPTYAIESVPGMITAAWKDCLTEGFGVFDTSIASLQFAIDALLPDLYDALLDDGAAGLTRMTEILPGRLAAERAAIAEQDALDAIEAGDRAGEFASAMRDVEDGWSRIQHATEGLLCNGPGNLQFHLAADQKDDRYRSYRLTAPGKTPHLNSMPLVAWDVLRARFMPVVKRTGTYQRAAAVARPDARLFRIGEPLIDSLADYIRWDDRGQTFAFWRTSQHITDESVYFRFDYVIEADTEPAKLVLETRGGKFDRRALQRRADAFLPPRIVTLWSAIDGTDVDGDKVTRLLRAPYEPTRGDINLSLERRWALDELIGESDWEWRCRNARARSEEALRRQPSFDAACEDAVIRFTAASRTAVTQRRVRLTFLPARQRAAEESELAVDIDIDAALAVGMRKPHVRLDAVGTVVLSPLRPEGPGFARPRI
jgi:ATP-dependent helicase HepA